MVIGPLQFDEPAWLVLAPVLWAASLLIARKSLTGMGSRMRWVAQGVRLVVLTLAVMALAEPSYRLPGDGMSVVVVADESASMPDDARAWWREYFAGVSGTAAPGDRMGFVTVARDGRALRLASSGETPEDVFSEMIGPALYDPGSRDATNLAEGVGTALAIAPDDTAVRIVVVSDGNETIGSLIREAEAARARGYPIDVLPIPYTIENEIIFDKLVVPATARKGQAVRLRCLIHATRAGEVDLALSSEGRVYDLTPEAAGTTMRLALEAGVNAVEVPITIVGNGPQRFEASIESVDASADARIENNRAMGVTFVQTEGAVLIYAGRPAEAEPLMRALDESRVEVELASPDTGPVGLEALQAYDAVVLLNIGAYEFSGAQQEDLRAYVHDAGGGLVMIGGDESFGAGGWIGTPVADALPVKLDPPQKRQMPRGALALIMHSCEMPEGNFWGQKVAQAAVDALGQDDLVGVMEFAWGKGHSSWAHKLQPKGDGAAVAQSINGLQFGDMPDFGPTMQAVLTSLQGANAGAKHTIVISDGDPSGPMPSLVQGYIDAGISITTVCVFPHTGAQDVQKMKNIATATGGNSYLVNTQGALAQLPKIFIKEAQTVKRELIWEGEPISPHAVNPAAEAMRGIGGLPAISGYIITSDREGLSLITARAGEENDPLLAQWQYGLGRAVAYTSDAGARWSEQWLSWGRYRAFWDQHVRWAMRPTGSANVSVQTQTVGDETRVTVLALDGAGDPLNFARFKTRVIPPDGPAQDIEVTQTGPGRYEGSFVSDMPGSYLLTSVYDASRPDGPSEKGAVQASVTRPFAEEHRALQDNRALLERVAEMTGGRVLAGDARADDLFNRDGLDMPVALTPLWLRFAMWAIGLFLVDVAVRRVRIDLIGMARGIRRTLMRKQAASTSQIDAMRAARERAKSRTVQKAPEAGRTAKVKFEADAEKLKSAPESPIDAQRRAPLIDTRTPEKAAGADEDDPSMSRLLKAKKRAQEETEKRREDEKQQ